MREFFNADAIVGSITNSDSSERQETSVVVFRNDEYGQVRMIMRGDEPWFVARDVCACLGLEKMDRAVAPLESGEKGAHTVSTPGGPQKMTIVSEPGLYDLVSRSRKPYAKAFWHWVRHEVLVSIRKTGGYITPQAREKLLADPDLIIALATEVKALRASNAELERTKAWIGSKREATAMATASVAVRQNAKLTEANAVLSAENADLKDERGKGETFKTVENIPWLRKVFKLSRGAFVAIGIMLSKIARALGIEPHKVPGQNRDVNAYHVDVIDEFKRQVDTDPAILAKYRLS